MTYKVLVSGPMAMTIISAAVNGGAPETALLWWAVVGAASGAYACAVWMLLPALLGATLPVYWRALTALRVSVLFLVGLFLSLGIASQWGLHWHPWTIAAMAFVLALSANALKPVIEKIVVGYLQRRGGSL